MNQVKAETLEDVENDDNDTLNNTMTTEDTNQMDDNFINVPVVVATSDVNVRDNINGNILGVLSKGDSVELIEKINDTHYKVLYYGKVAYVVADYVTEDSIVDIDQDIMKVFYATEDKTLYIPSNLNETGEDGYKEISKYECLEVYEEIDDYYLVQTDEYVGYVTKDNLKELQGTFAVLDIDEQDLKIYEDNQVVLEAPVITGKPETPTRIGNFKIYEITYNRYLIGKGNSYKSWVDVMMKFDGNIGFHDAEYHTDEDGRKHGWRKKSDFSRDKYKKSGSHGCVNLQHEDAMAVSELVEVGTSVLIK